MQILQAPIVIGMGIAFGVTWGVVCIYVPSTVEVDHLQQQQQF